MNELHPLPLCVGCPHLPHVDRCAALEIAGAPFAAIAFGPREATRCSCYVSSSPSLVALAVHASTARSSRRSRGRR